MDKSQAIGFVVLTIFLVAYFIFQANQEPQQLPPTEELTPTEQLSDNNQPEIQEPVNESTDSKPDSTIAAELAEEHGIFASAAEGEEKIEILENENIIVEISTKSGLIHKVTLKQYEDYNYNPLVIIDGTSSKMELDFAMGDKIRHLSDYYFLPSNDFTPKTDTLAKSFKLTLTNGKSITHTYYLPKTGYALEFASDYSALDGSVNNNAVKFSWQNDIKRVEQDLKYSRQWTQINYFTTSNEFSDVNSNSDELSDFQIQQPVSWFTFKQKFFTSGLIANQPFEKGYFSIKVDEQDTSTVKSAYASVEMPISSFEKNSPFSYYFGPLKRVDLKPVAEGFHKNLYTGWPVIRAINQNAIIPIFNFLEKHIASYGIIIIILVFIIRIVLTPLTYRSHFQMAKTKVMKPEIDELKKKYEGDMQKFQSEQMKLYRQVGVNPLSGCVPLLLQMPILFAMFQFIPHAIELRHESFLWAKDLSTYDAIISWSGEIPLITFAIGNHISLFTLLMTLSTILITVTNTQVSTVEGPMKTMQYMMPIIFFFVLNSFPAGLTFYYFVSNIVSFAQMTIIKKFVNEDKIKLILEGNRKKNVNKKKSKFQLKLEEAMKAGEEAKKKKKTTKKR